MENIPIPQKENLPFSMVLNIIPFINGKLILPHQDPGGCGMRFCDFGAHVFSLAFEVISA